MPQGVRHSWGMDERTRKLIDDYHSWQQGGDGNDFAHIAREWWQSLRPRKRFTSYFWRRFAGG